MDFSKLETNDWLIGGGGVALFVFSFFPWFTFGGFGSQSGWSNIFSMLGILVGIAITAFLIVDRLTEVDLPEMPLPMGLVYLIGTGVALALILLQLLLGSSIGGGFGGSVSLDRSLGIFLGTIAAGAMTAGGFLKFQADNKGGGATGGGGSTPPQSF